MIGGVDVRKVLLAAFGDEIGLCDHRHACLDHQCHRRLIGNRRMFDSIAGDRSRIDECGQREHEFSARYAVRRGGSAARVRIDDARSQRVEIRQRVLVQHDLQGPLRQGLASHWTHALPHSGSGDVRCGRVVVGRGGVRHSGDAVA